MITGYYCWHRIGHVTAYLIASFNGDGSLPDYGPGPFTLSVIFDDNGPFGDADKYGEPQVNVPVPVFKPTESRKADAWLKRYAIRLNRWMEKTGRRPVPKEAV